MRTRILGRLDGNLAPDVFAQIVTDVFLKDAEDLSKNESQFSAVMVLTMKLIAEAIAKELEPKIKDIILSRIDCEALVKDAARARVEALLFTATQQATRG